MKNDNLIDISSTGYAAQLFSIFNNIKYFCFQETKRSECLLCWKITEEIIKELKSFVNLTNTNIFEGNLFNILLSKYKEKYTYDCKCRWGEKEDALCRKTKYNILEYPVIMFLLFDMQFDQLNSNKDLIYKIFEDKIMLNFNCEYKLLGIIVAPKPTHFNAIIFNPI